MTNCTRYLGLDVHAETISAAIAEGRGADSEPRKIRIDICGTPRALLHQLPVGSDSIAEVRFGGHSNR
jgi:hypothetical protein